MRPPKRSLRRHYAQRARQRALRYARDVLQMEGFSVQAQRFTGGVGRGGWYQWRPEKWLGVMASTHCKPCSREGCCGNMRVVFGPPIGELRKLSPVKKRLHNPRHLEQEIEDYT
jgi:hypothetical protein